MLRIVGLRGPRYLWYLMTGYALPRAVGWMVFESKVSSFLQRLIAGLGGRLAPACDPLGKRTISPENFLSAPEWLPKEVWEAAASRHRESGQETLVLGEVDNDGRIKLAAWVSGRLPDTDEVDAEAFTQRRRHRLELVVDFEHGDGVILVRKDFLGNEPAFRREWRSLAALDGTTGCPKVYRVDEHRLQLYKSFVGGPTVRQRLIHAGARILSVDTDVDRTLAELGPVERIEAVWARGRDHFQALPGNFFAELEERVAAMHRAGVTGFSLTFGNVVLDPQQGPSLIDFDRAIKHRRSRGLLFAVGRDRDLELFNRIYGRDVLTERSARQLVRSLATPYSPFDLGRGLATRGFWSVDSGTGRWQILNQRVMSELLDGGGRRILDLGSYSGLMPLLMLKAGAREVVALEKSSRRVAQARELSRLFEWRDMTRYNLDLRHADMRAILDGDWGTFDIVTAFCSLYYLDEPDMRRIVRRAAGLAPIMVLQAKIDTDPSAADDKARKSSLPFLRHLLEINGFPQISVVAPEGYPRPLLIGRREA